MVAGAAVKNARVNIGTRGSGETLKKIAHQFDLKISNPRRANFGVDNRDRASAEIDSGQAESFVHRHEEITGSQNAAAISQRAVKGLTESDSDIFDGMVLIDVEVAIGCKFEVESPVASEEFQHVVEKTDSGGDFVFAAAIDGERDANFGFGSFAMQAGFSHTGTSLFLTTSCFIGSG
jgi:hypothetical protein